MELSYKLKVQLGDGQTDIRTSRAAPLQLKTCVRIRSSPRTGIGPRLCSVQDRSRICKTNPKYSMTTEPESMLREALVIKELSV